VKDFSGNEVNLHDQVIFTDHTGTLKKGRICDLRKYGAGIINDMSTGLPMYWRKSNEIAKIVPMEVLEEDKVRIVADMFPVGKEPRIAIHEDEKGTYYIKEELHNAIKGKKYPKRKKKKKVLDLISNKRFDNIRDAIPGVEWDLNSVEIVSMGYGDRPSFTMMGSIRELINGKVRKVKWHTHAPGGSYSRFYVMVKGSMKPLSVKANLKNGQKVLGEIIKMLKAEK